MVLDAAFADESTQRKHYGKRPRKLPLASHAWRANTCSAYRRAMKGPRLEMCDLMARGIFGLLALVNPEHLHLIDRPGTLKAGVRIEQDRLRYS